MSSALRFRNIDASPDDPVRTWPYEGVAAAIERGYLSDWRKIAAEIDHAPWGKIARYVEQYATYGEAEALAELLNSVAKDAREQTTRREISEVASQVRQAIKASQLTAAEFAAECGTSASRMSTYASGTVTPSAAMLLRIHGVAKRFNQ